MNALKFKHADPSRRIPTYLQPNTVENLVWQLKLTAVLLVGVMIYDRYEERKFRKAIDEWEKNPT